jgi:hypothetical protein
MVGFEEIIPARNGIFEKHKPQWGNPPEVDKSRSQ